MTVKTGYFYIKDSEGNVSRVVTPTPEYVGATSSVNGVPGLVPGALSAEKDKFLKGDGNWGNAIVNASFSFGTTKKMTPTGHIRVPLSVIQAINADLLTRTLSVDSNQLPWKLTYYINTDNSTFIVNDADDFIVNHPSVSNYPVWLEVLPLSTSESGNSVTWRIMIAYTYSFGALFQECVATYPVDSSVKSETDFDYHQPNDNNNMVPDTYWWAVNSNDSALSASLDENDHLQFALSSGAQAFIIHRYSTDPIITIEYANGDTADINLAQLQTSIALDSFPPNQFVQTLPRDQTIGGFKTFKNSEVVSSKNSIANIVIRNNLVTKGTVGNLSADSARHYTQVIFGDKDGETDGTMTGRLGMLEHASPNNLGTGNTYMTLGCYAYDRSSTSTARINVGFDDNGIAYADAPATNATRTSATDIITRGYVMGASGANAHVGLVPAPPTTAGTTKYLREDGTWQVPPDTNTDTDTHWTSHLYAGASGTAANATTTNGNTTLVLADNSTVRANIKLKGSGATTVTSDASGNITISSTDTNTTYTIPTNTSWASTAPGTAGYKKITASTATASGGATGDVWLQY